ncbi:MAG: NAD(P)H-hydrate dehydratase [Brevinematales bacterium]|nr:NAD(P)H-hydrate dehydratase [Brevinematales bacterium]
MYIATKEDVYHIDQECERRFEIKVSTLMENAGKNSFVWIKNNITEYDKKRILVFCAHGNNGGDGAVLARYIYDNGGNVKVIFLGDVIGKSKDVAKTNFIKLKESKVEVIELDLRDSLIVEKVKDLISGSDIVIDSIFGVGFSGEFYSPFKEIVDIINSSGKLVLSLDIPSGVIANGGNFETAIKADYTLTFGFPKFGMIDYPGAYFCGKIEVIDIGIPENLIKERKLFLLLTDEYVKRLLKKRARDTHKGNYGHLLIIGGYGGDFKKGIKAMGGSVILSGLAALRSGVGLLTIACHNNVLYSIQSSIPEAMTFGWLENNKSIESIKKLIENNFIRTVLIGNGFFNGKFQKRLLEMLLSHPIVNRIVIDADGLNILSKDSKLLKELSSSGKNIILTPHIGEASRLLKLYPHEIKNKKLDVIKMLVDLTNSTVILKDSVSLICDGENVFVNNRGSSSLAKGGSGDILAGLVAGFLASGYDPLYASLLGSYILGVAGEKCELRLGAYSVLGRDVIIEIAEVIKELNKPE